MCAKRKGFRIWHVCFLWQGLFNSAIKYEHVALTVTFDLLLENFNIEHVCYSYLAYMYVFLLSWPFQLESGINFKHVTLTVNFDLLL